MNPGRVLLLGIALCCSSCAAIYRSIDPRRLPYMNESEDNGVLFSYRYNVLAETGNHKYSKKELKKGTQLIAVRIRNYSDKEYQIGQSLNFFVNESKAPLLDVNHIQKSLKQSPYIHLLYLGLIPITAAIQDQSIFRGSRRGRTTSIPTPYYFIGPGLAAGNIGIVLNSNKRFLTDLKRFDLNGKVIKPGEEVYGLIGLPYNGYDPLFLQVNPQ